MSLDIQKISHQNWLLKVVFSPSGKHLAAADDTDFAHVLRPRQPNPLLRRFRQ